MRSRNFSFDKLVRTYVRPPLHVSRGETLHFKHPARFGGKSHGHRDFKRETERKNNNNNKKAEFFVRLNFNVYINVENRERAKARNTQQLRPISLEEKHQNFTAAVRKWEMLAATKVKMCGNKKKKVSGNTQHFVYKTCSRGKQWQRDVRKGAARAKLFFTVVVVFPDSLVLHDFIFCLSKL